MPTEAAPAPKQPTCPSFTEYFDVNTPLPGKRSAEFGGYILDCPEPAYRSWPGVNASVLKERTPCEMLHNMMASPKSTAALTEGTLLHWAVLEQWRFAAWRDHMVVSPTKGLDTKAAEEVRFANPGKLVVTDELVIQANKCMDAVRANDRAMAWLSGIDPDHGNAPKSPVAREATGVVWDGQHGVWRKIRVDLYPAVHRVMLDVKTSAAPLSQWFKECLKWGYFDQAAWYLDTHYRLTGEWRAWLWIVVTKSEPFMCRVFRLTTPKPTDPLYAESSYCKARQRLGLDPVPPNGGFKLGRLQMFLNSARETEQLRSLGVEMHPRLLRQTWPAYEDETPEYEIF
ncbi:PD-(D/E)XK nuclease-like domain-containing protein [Verrucomicrobium sp. BvORR106]|uniref:PD-(D/E)XK nuclease-like domain-containing protein n=1 Tax=Verrucomicrobium sp. BvORR106 TaxID=1403819 RepID=UPI000B1595CC|nr:PD-(D/E)XK nuclease-like domain-containing protein [Verrucomicrobium sp. BvORR106]